MTNKPEFRAWEKIPREHQETIVITEKLDGTNACVIVSEDGEVIGAQSRKRLITPEKDNYGFARWVEENKEELSKLGHGHHHGEWAGLGIQSNKYDLPEKQFYLFNTARWGEHNPNTPSVCGVVPILYQGSPANPSEVYETIMQDLKESGSHLDTGEKYQGYVEGVVTYYSKHVD